MTSIKKRFAPFVFEKRIWAFRLPLGGPNYGPIEVLFFICLVGPMKPNNQELSFHMAERGATNRSWGRERDTHRAQHRLEEG